MEEARLEAVTVVGRQKRIVDIIIDGSNRLGQSAVISARLEGEARLEALKV